MAPASSTELRDTLREAKGELKDWTLELEKASVALKEAMEMKSDELMEGARERIVTAKESIAQAKEDIQMIRKGTALPTAAVHAGMIDFHRKFPISVPFPCTTTNLPMIYICMRYHHHTMNSTLFYCHFSVSFLRPSLTKGCSTCGTSCRTSVSIAIIPPLPSSSRASQPPRSPILLLPVHPPHSLLPPSTCAPKATSCTSRLPLHQCTSS